MLIIGLTGTIASGKSTVASMLKSANIAIIDADELAREVTKKPSKALASIRKTFGDQYFFNDGRLNRKLLGQLVFNDPSALKKLEQIVHPLIDELRKEKMKFFKKNDVPVLVLVIPLLFEKNLQKEVDKILLVSADADVLIDRLMRRDGYSRAQALKMLSLQLSEPEKKATATMVIKNNGSLGELKNNLIKAWKCLTKMELTFTNV